MSPTDAEDSGVAPPRQRSPVTLQCHRPQGHPAPCLQGPELSSGAVPMVPGWEKKSRLGGMGMLSTLQDRGYGHPLAVTASVSKGQQSTHSEKGAEPAAGSGPVREGCLKPRPAPASVEATNNLDGLSCPRLKAP